MTTETAARYTALDMLRILRDARCKRLVQRDGMPMVRDLDESGYRAARQWPTDDAIASGWIAQSDYITDRDGSPVYLITAAGNAAYDKTRTELLATAGR